MPWVSLQCVSVLFADHTYLLLSVHLQHTSKRYFNGVLHYTQWPSFMIRVLPSNLISKLHSDGINLKMTQLVLVLNHNNTDRFAIMMKSTTSKMTSIVAILKIDFRLLLPKSK